MISVRFPKIFDDLYAGTMDDAAWARAMLGIADAVRASGAMLISYDPSSGALLREESHRVDPFIPNEYARYWTYHDIRRDCGRSVPVGVPVTEDILQVPGWRRSPFLNDFLLPADIPHFLPVWLHKSDGKMAALSLQGSRKRGPFGPTDIDVVRQLAPHVARALEIRDRLESVNVRAHTLAGSLDRVGFGTIVLDRGGRLLEANVVAQELLARGRGIRCLPDSTVWLNEPAGTQLARWIATRSPPAVCTDGLLHAPRDGALPLSITVTPLPEQSTSWMRRDPQWLLLVFDPERRVQASAEVIARDLGLTAREAEVTAMLAAGHSLQQIAKRLRVSEHTVRTQLKSVFGKTGTHTQSDLIRRVVLGPAVLDSTDATPSGRQGLKRT